MIQERKHLRKDIPQMVKQQLPNHQIQPQSESITEQQPQGETATDTQQEPVPSQFSSDDSLPDPSATTTKTFEMKDPRSIPKKPKYSLRPKILHI